MSQEQERRVEVSPGGVGFIRTAASRDFPGKQEDVRRKWWVEGRPDDRDEQ